MTEEKLKPVWVDIEWLKPYENNAKLHDDKQVEKIAASIKEFGWTTAIVVDKDGGIIAGHGRRLAGYKVGAKKVPVLIRDDLTPDQVKALRLADNRVALSGFDGNLLKIELQEIDLDMGSIFDAKELAFLEADLSVIDDSAFVADIDSAVREQAKETAEKVSAADDIDVPIAKALGFKTIKTRDEKYVASFLATIEEQTGKQGAEAFVVFARGFS